MPPHLTPAVTGCARVSRPARTSVRPRTGFRALVPTVKSMAAGMRTRVLNLLVVPMGVIGVMAVGVPSASAYEFSSATKDACPACLTADGESAAAEIASGLTINGPQSPTYGSTLHLIDDAKLFAGSAGGDGATDVALSLLKRSVSDAFATSPFKTTGLAVGAFATGYVIGTLGRTLFVHLSGGTGPDHGSGAVAGDAPWSNARWVMCTESPSCVTSVYSSAWESPVIPTGSIYARFDSTWLNQNFSVTGTSGYTDCYGSTPPAAPCTLTYFGSSGPQPAELPGAQAITVYGMGTSARPGYVFLQTLQQLLDRAQTNGVIDSSQASGTQFGSVPPATPSKTDALGAVDDATAANSDFGGFLEGEIESHWPTIPDCDNLTEAACETAIRNAGFHGTLTARTLSASEAIIARDPNKVTATSPSGLAKADPGTAITIYVNATKKTTLTHQQTVIATALKANNPGVVTDANKADIARACEEWVTAQGSKRTISDCTTPGIPIYVIGREWPQAADHTIQALASWAPWVLLTYNQPDPSTKGWYVNYPETGKSSGSCKGRYLQPNPAATACDEWPWRATEQGGPPANGAHMPHLKIINALQNSSSGSRYFDFITECRVNAAKAAPTPTNGGGRFLVVPMPSQMPRSFMSLDVCNGSTATP